MTHGSVIALDDETTWPDDVTGPLSVGFNDLVLFERERRRIDRLAERDVVLRCNPPPNRFAATRDTLHALLDAALADAHYVGYHCTRLHADEVDRIRQVGLLPLGADVLEARVRRRVAAGDLRAGQGERILAQHDADDRNRRGMIWFVFTKRLLRWESGVWRLLTYWGGEALYRRHEDDPELGTALKAIGTACIVEAMVPARVVQAYASPGELVVRSFLHRRRVSTDHGPGAEGYVREPVPASRIRAVHRCADRRFQSLTRCGSWSEMPT